MSLFNKLLLTLAVAFLCLSGTGVAQSYIYDAGNPSYGANIPVENGYITVSNGNLHMEFHLAQHPQRGNLKLDEKLVYDSHFWKIGHYSKYYWWPDNLPRTAQLAVGWRFVTGGETGTLSWNSVGNGFYFCDGDIRDKLQKKKDTWSWLGPDGTNHVFDVAFPYGGVATCDGDAPPLPKTVTGSAVDSSGYILTASGDANYGPDTVTISDTQGNQVYPQVMDRYGNYFTADSNGNLVDDRGLTPVLVTYSGNQIFYDVLREGGGRARYTVTTVAVTPHTAFNQQAVNEYPNGNNAQDLNGVQSITLPDGSSYSFSYDPWFGEITQVTLPTGGIIKYGYSLYTDSYQNVNRWLTSRTTGGDPSSTFTPQVLTQCSSGGTGCQEQVTVHEPGGNETVYNLTLNNGAWATTTYRYSGAAANGALVSTAGTTYDFSTACQNNCTGSAYVTAENVTTTLADTGAQRTDTYQYHDRTIGLLSNHSIYDFYQGSLPPTPLSQTVYTYGASTSFPGDASLISTQDGNGNPVTQKRFTYTSSAVSTSGLPNHTATTLSGAYLQSTSDWVNTDGRFLSIIAFW